MENSLVVSQKAKHRTTIQPHNSSPRQKKRWKQPKYPSTGEQINKLEYYLAIRQNEGLLLTCR